MADKFPLSLIIKAVDEATAPLRAINEKLQKFTAPIKKIETAFGNVGSEIFSLSSKLGAFAGVAGFGLFHVVKGAVDAGDKLAEMADRVGLSVDAYAQLQFAAAQADIEQESFNGAMDQFNKRLGEAKAGGGPLLSFLQKVSPALALQVKGAKSTEEAFGLMTRAMAKIEDPGKRAALAASVFGKSGLQMGNFLHQGTAEIEKQRAKFLDLAGSQEAFARGAGDLDNVMRETETAFLGLRNAAAGALFPAFKQLALVASKFMAENREGLRVWAETTGKAIADWVAGGGIQRVVGGLQTLASVIGTVVSLVGGLKGVLVIAGAFMAGPLIASIGSLVGVLVSFGTVALGPIIGLAAALGVSFTPFLLVAGGIAAAAALIIANWEPIKAFFESLWQSMKSPVEALKTAGSFWAANLGFLGGGTIGAARAAPAAAGGRNTEARVVVDFTNAPKGTRVTPDKGNTAPLDVGMSMVNQ